MSILSEPLEELLRENHLSRKEFADKIGISASRVTDYLCNDKLPTVETLIKIADYFQCSTDFLLSKDYGNSCHEFCKPVPFAQRLEFLKSSFNLTHKDLYSIDGITKSRYFEWLNGKRQPSVDSVLKIANALGCSVDYVLGREK